MSFFNPFRRSAAPPQGAFSGAGRRVDGRGDGEEHEQEQAIRLVIKFERDRFNIPIKKPSSTPLSTLIETLSQHTSIPASQLKLISNGAVLKNPALPISSFGLRDGSTIVLVGANQAVPAASAASGPSGSMSAAQGKKKEVVPDTEPGLVEYIKGKTDFVDELKDDRERYMADVEAYCAGPSGSAAADSAAPTPSAPGPPSTSTPSKPTSSTIPSTTPSHAAQSALPPPSRPAFTSGATYPALERAHARLSEILLQGLLKLDGTTVPPEWTAARAARKASVREVQKRLDEVDEAWARCKKRRREVGE